MPPHPSPVPRIPRRSVGDDPAPQGGLRTERRTPGSLTEAEVTAWRALTRRALEPSIFADPDVLLPTAQHLAVRRHMALLLVWEDGRGGRPRALRGVLALQRRPRLPRLPLGEALMARYGRSVAPCAPLVEAAQAVPVLTAMLATLAEGPRRAARLVLPEVPPGGALAAALDQAARSLGRTVARRPRREAPAVPPAVPADSVSSTTEPRDLRDGVELFLALEARTASPCLLDDPVEATVLRVVTRRLARRRLCRVSLARRNGVLVGAALSLRQGRDEVLWRGTGALAGRAPPKMGDVVVDLRPGDRRGLGSAAPARVDGRAVAG